jgi:hypothetical protein
MSTNPTRDDFAALLDETLGAAASGGFEGRVVKGTVTAIENDKAVIDVGLKSEGRVALREFAAPASRTASRSATKSKCSSTASKTPTAKPCCRATAPAAKPPGTSSKPNSAKASALKA